MKNKQIRENEYKIMYLAYEIIRDIKSFDSESIFEQWINVMLNILKAQLAIVKSQQPMPPEAIRGGVIMISDPGPEIVRLPKEAQIITPEMHKEILNNNNIEIKDITITLDGKELTSVIDKKLEK